MTDRHAAFLTIAALAAAAGAALPASIARAGDYACAIPRALLCDGCASQIAITLAPRGGCRVSFTPVAPGTTPTGATSFTFHVQTPAVAAVAKPRAEAAPKPPSAKCFVYNNNQYCE